MYAPCGQAMRIGSLEKKWAGVYQQQLYNPSEVGLKPSKAHSPKSLPWLSVANPAIETLVSCNPWQVPSCQLFKKVFNIMTYKKINLICAG